MFYYWKHVQLLLILILFISLPQYLKDKEEIIKMFCLDELDDKYLDYIDQSNNPYKTIYK